LHVTYQSKTSCHCLDNIVITLNPTNPAQCPGGAGGTCWKGSVNDPRCVNPTASITAALVCKPDPNNADCSQWTLSTSFQSVPGCVCSLATGVTDTKAMVGDPLEHCPDCIPLMLVFDNLGGSCVSTVGPGLSPCADPNCNTMLLKATVTL
jgi:hypothetical protein